MNRARLDTVLRIRSLQERLARGEIEHERAVAARCDHAVSLAQSAVDARVERTPTSPAAFVAQREMLDVGTQQIGVAAATSAQAQLELSRAVIDWTLTRRRLEGVERLDERLAREAVAENAAREQLELDDIIVTRWKRAVR